MNVVDAVSLGIIRDDCGRNLGETWSLVENAGKPGIDPSFDCFRIGFSAIRILKLELHDHNRFKFGHPPYMHTDAQGLVTKASS